MGYLVFTRRGWARQILLAAVVVFGVHFVLRDGITAFGPLSLSDISPYREHAIYLEWRMNHLSSFFFHLSIVVFSVLFLCHPDVVASFRGRANTTKI